MSRIAGRFARRKAEGRAAFVAFLTAGDPSLERTVAAACELDAAGVGRARAGRAVLRPARRRAGDPALERAGAGARGDARRVLETVRRIRERASCRCCCSATSTRCCSTASSASPRDAKDAGVDGVLVTDLPPEEAGEWTGRGARGGSRHGLPRRADEPRRARLRRVAEASRGFVYAVSRTGVTGERQARLGGRAAAGRAAARAHGRAGGARVRALDARAGGARPPRWRTAWWSGARWCASWRSTRRATSGLRCDG